MNNFPIELILDNLRSAQNVGSILRTAECLGVSRVVFCGITPHPRLAQDDRPPHVIATNERAIHKTALGAERALELTYFPHTLTAIQEAKTRQQVVVALEQAPGSVRLSEYRLSQPIALVLPPDVDKFRAVPSSRPRIEVLFHIKEIHYISHD